MSDNFDTIVTECLADKRASGNTQKTESGDNEKIQKFLWWLRANYPELKDVSEITKQHTRGYMLFLRAPKNDRWGKPNKKGPTLTPYTVWSYSSRVKAWLNWCVRQGYLKDNPFCDIKLITQRSAKTTFKVIPDEDLAKLFEWLDRPGYANEYKGCRNVALFYVLADSFVRVGELLSMRTDGLNLKNNCFDVSGKTGLRTAYMSSTATNALEVYLKAYRNKQRTKSLKVWLTDEGEPLSLSAVQSLCVRINKELGLAISPHKFRHTGITSLANENVSAFIVQGLAGHSKITTTQVYYSQNDRVLREAQERNSPLTNFRKQGIIKARQNNNSSEIG